MIKYIILFIILLLSVLSDLKTSKIRNIYTVSTIIAGFAVNIYFSGIYGFKESIKGSILPVLILGIFFYARLIGAGDIKLYSSIGAVFGIDFVIMVAAYSFLICGLYSLVMLKIKRRVLSTLVPFIREIKICFMTHSLFVFENKTTRTFVRLSPAIAAGCLFQILLTL
ncbi:A24 family peptidase [Clostridium sp. BNL1100]|uniref:A24 family peptidase n=1 Tax=Clostridium sp. BNL1100 TaxID=755731 RepID=UPI00024A7CA1|nr:A24 family peptidase [Clostridium sp. BNL1100]AEY65760.1 Flp pilus assembly protein, protease CpaA [Clostridium sp. BNL1100]